MMKSSLERPVTTVILAMSADGKISDTTRSPVLFGSPTDKAHLEQQVAIADGILAGAGTLRAGGTAMRVIDPELLKQREQQGKPPQPVQIICSRSGKIDPQLGFFKQPIPRWLLATSVGAREWNQRPEFDRILIAEEQPQDSESQHSAELIHPESNIQNPSIDWPVALQQIASLGLKRLAVLGGGELIASLLAADLIDEFWLTVCPLILGGTTAPTPVDGSGFLIQHAPRLQLLEVQHIEDEVFLHYRLRRDPDTPTGS